MNVGHTNLPTFKIIISFRAIKSLPTRWTVLPLRRVVFSPTNSHLSLALLFFRFVIINDNTTSSFIFSLSRLAAEPNNERMNNSKNPSGLVIVRYFSSGGQPGLQS